MGEGGKGGEQRKMYSSTKSVKKKLHFGHLSKFLKIGLSIILILCSFFDPGSHAQLSRWAGTATK